MSDLISRQAVIDIIHLFFTEEVDKIPTKKTEDGEVYIIHKCQPLFEMNKAICKRIKALPSASPTQNCVENALGALDCISRQAVIKAIYDNKDRLNIAQAIRELPPVNPQEPKIGRWVDDKCSVCGKGIEDLIDSSEWYRNEEPNFCPFCGVRIVDRKRG